MAAFTASLTAVSVASPFEGVIAARVLRHAGAEAAVGPVLPGPSSSPAMRSSPTSPGAVFDPISLVVTYPLPRFLFNLPKHAYEGLVLFILYGFLSRVDILCGQALPGSPCLQTANFGERG